MGLSSDTESDLASSNSEPEEREDNEQEDKGFPVENPSQASLHAPTLPRSQSTASIVSQLSVSSSSAKADDSEDKCSKFDECFKTAMSTDKEVLSKCYSCFTFVLRS